RFCPQPDVPLSSSVRVLADCNDYSLYIPCIYICYAHLQFSSMILDAYPGPPACSGPESARPYAGGRPCGLKQFYKRFSDGRVLAQIDRFCQGKKNRGENMKGRGNGFLVQSEPNARNARSRPTVRPRPSGGRNLHHVP